MKGEKNMKKLISIILVLVLSLAAVSALASPVGLDILTIDGSKIKALTEGVKFEEKISQPSIDLANAITVGSPVTIIYVGDDGKETSNPESGNQLSTFCITPLPQYDRAEDAAEGPAKFEIPVSAYTAGYLKEHLENKDLVVYFVFQDGDIIYKYELSDMSVVTKDDGTNAFAFSIPDPVAKAAADKPLTLEFDIRVKKAE